MYVWYLQLTIQFITNMESQKKIQVLRSGLDICAVIRKIIERPNQEDPFFVCDVSQLIWSYKNWKRLMPRVEIFYAVKCNYHKLVLEIFASIGMGFDCASKEEIRKVLALDVSPNKIIFANPTKLISHIKYAAEVGVRAMTFDNKSELHKIKKHHPKAELILRIRFDDKSAKVVFGEKFGTATHEETWNLLKIAKSLNLNVVGVAFHVGSACENYDVYYNGIAAARKTFEIGAELGYQFKLLDIGGGFPGETSKPIDEVAGFVNKGLDDYFPDETIKIVAEPGKYAVNTAFKLVSQISSKNIVNQNNQDIRMYYVDVSLYGSLYCIYFHEYPGCKPVYEVEKNKLYPSIVWGATQDTIDRLTEKYHYLPNLQIGDWIMFEEAGSYTLSINCGYNGFSIPDVCAVVTEEDWLMLSKSVSKPICEDRFATEPSMKSFLEELRLEPYISTSYF